MRETTLGFFLIYSARTFIEQNFSKNGLDTKHIYGKVNEPTQSNSELQHLSTNNYKLMVSILLIKIMRRIESPSNNANQLSHSFFFYQNLFRTKKGGRKMNRKHIPACKRRSIRWLGQNSVGLDPKGEVGRERGRRPGWD